MKKDQWKSNSWYYKKDSDLKEIDFEKILQISKNSKSLIYTSEKDNTDNKTIYEYTLQDKEITMKCKDANNKFIYSSQMTIDIIKSIVANATRNKVKSITKKFHTNPEKQIMQPMKKTNIKNF